MNFLGIYFLEIYDNAGNRLSKVLGSESTTYSYDARNRLVQSVANGTTTVYDYDNNGNLVKTTKGTEITAYTCDGFNRLKETNMPDGTWMNNFYDAFGMRTAVVENSIRSDFTLDGDNVIAETSSGKNIRYLRGLGLIANQENQGEYAYYLHNAHGDVVNLVNGTGDILNSYNYDAFGNEETYTETVANRFMYAGEQFDKVTGQYYLRARYYAPQVGRFITEDPINDGLNWYTYCENNPIRFIDPNGLERIVVSGGDYSDDSVHPGFSYNFIEPAISKIVEYRKANRDESIAWLIADAGWSNTDWSNFLKAVEELKVDIVKVRSKEELISYVNNKKCGDSRENDKITKFTVFSHGMTGKLMLGYNYSTSYNSNLNFYTSDIARIDSNAFDNPDSWFGSCNTGTGGSNSFAQAWASKVRGKTTAFEGKTTYAYIMFPREYGGVFNKVTRFLGISPWNQYKKLVQGLRADYGFSKSGSAYYPEAADKARQVTFTR